MSLRPVSVSTVLFDGHSMDLAIAEIAAAGGGAIEPAFIEGYVDFDESVFSPRAAAALIGRLDAAHLTAGAVSAHLDLSEPEAATALARRIGFAGDLGAPFLITNSGPAAKADAIRRTVEAVLPVLEATGVTLALENPGHGDGNLTGTTAAAAAFIAAIGAPLVRMNHDAGNVFTYSRQACQPADDLRHAPRIVAHAHLKDVLDRDGGWAFCAIGDGDVDLAAYLAALPPGCPVSIELPLRLSRPSRLDPVRAGAPVPLDALRAALSCSLHYLAARGG
ncbi:sugar phosphate isomerase/epimerase family protein [Ensifer soli]|uniref:sugar phosphate isomerase/epimerase family protein n=1 Tax=Ciceribacter sp. sgz301302 TaxID=3342379 RepID=UPI0035B78812